MLAGKWLFGFALAVAAPAMVFAQAQRVSAPRQADWSRTRALLKSYVDHGKVPGIVAVIGHGGGPPRVFAYGRTGTAPDARAVDEDTLWRVYSMTKPVTAVAAMLLVEDGRLELDQPIADFIPAFRSMRVATAPETSLDSRPATRPVTVRHLMTHSGGLGYAIMAKGPLKAEYERLGVLPLSIDAKSEAEMRKVRPISLAAFADRAAQLPLVAEPGTVWSYSMGLDVLARVIEVAGGMPYERFLETRLFAPLKMRDSGWTAPADKRARFVTNYAYAGDRLVPLDPAEASVFGAAPSFPYGGAGLVMSARDYDRFLAMMQGGGALDGVRVMKPETAKLAMSNLLPPGVSYKGFDGKTLGGGFGAGGTSAGSDSAGGPGAGTWGWGGAAGTIAFYDPRHDVRATIMVNYFPADRWPLREEASAAIYADIAR